MLVAIIINVVAIILCCIVAGSYFEKNKGWKISWYLLLAICNTICLFINIERYVDDKSKSQVIITNIERDGKNISFSATATKEYLVSSDLESVSTQIGDTCIFNRKRELVKNLSLERRISGE